jgi:hypothetical protein
VETTTHHGECRRERPAFSRDGSLVFSPTAKDVAVTITPDGKVFTIVAPAYDEPNEWDSKMKKGMFRGAK